MYVDMQAAYLAEKIHNGSKKGYTKKEYDVCKEARYWDKKCYHDYMQKHGQHFSKPLAEWAVGMNVNTHGTGGGEHWTCEQVKEALTAKGVTITEQNKYDAYYLANTFYSDYFYMPTVTEAVILQLVHSKMMDKDGYDGEIFDMFIAKSMGKCLEIPFGEVL